MENEDIKPIPKYIVKLIQKKDKQVHPYVSGETRYYSYLYKIKGELAKITVAVRSKGNKWCCKQCAIHMVHSKVCYVKDMCFTYIGGYRVGWYYEGLTKYPKWYEDKSWGWADDKYFRVYAPVVNMEYLNKFPKYKYACWDRWQKDIISYLRLYEQYPQVEYLIKAGLQKIALSKQILLLIAKDKLFCKWLWKNKEKLQYDRYYVDVIIRAYKTGKNIDELQRDKEFRLTLSHDETYRQIKREYDNALLAKIVRYVYEKDISFATYKDYLNACNYLGLDMTRDKNMFPKDFTFWHDIRTDEYRTAKAIKDAEERKELYKQFAEIANKYLDLQHSGKSAFICIIAKSPADLINEGSMLNHCVGRMGYDQKFIREESLIFFIRTKEQPEVPYVTIEYSPTKHKILQLHGVNNTAPNDETKHYIQKVWLPYANKHLKQLAAA